MLLKVLNHQIEDDIEFLEFDDIPGRDIQYEWNLVRNIVRKRDFWSIDDIIKEMAAKGWNLHPPNTISVMG